MYKAKFQLLVSFLSQVFFFFFWYLFFYDFWSFFFFDFFINHNHQNGDHNRCGGQRHRRPVRRLSDRGRSHISTYHLPACWNKAKYLHLMRSVSFLSFFSLQMFSAANQSTVGLRETLSKSGFLLGKRHRWDQKMSVFNK